MARCGQADPQAGLVSRRHDLSLVPVTDLCREARRTKAAALACRRQKLGSFGQTGQAHRVWPVCREGMAMAQREPRIKLRPTASCGREHDGLPGPCGHRRLPCGRESRDAACGRACWVDRCASQLILRSDSPIAINTKPCKRSVKAAVSSKQMHSPDQGQMRAGLMADRAGQVNLQLMSRYKKNGTVSSLAPGRPESRPDITLRCAMGASAANLA